MSTDRLTSDLSAYFEDLATHLPEFSLEDQRTALAIYRELAKGEPVDDARLASALGVGPAQDRVQGDPGQQDAPDRVGGCHYGSAWPAGSPARAGGGP